MDALYAAGSGTVADVRAAIADAPGYSAVRAMLRILEEKGHLTHIDSTGKYVYSPVSPRGSAAKSAVRRLLQTFFENSATKAVAALLDASDTKLSAEELTELAAMIDQARSKGNKR
jgi:BlaI family penicillinase repressor